MGGAFLAAGCGGTDAPENNRGERVRGDLTEGSPTHVGSNGSEHRLRLATLRKQGVAGAVRDFYGELEIGDFEAAWSRLDPAAQGEFNGYESWSSGYENTVSIVPRIGAISVTPTVATVSVRLRSTDIDACAEEVTQTFAGTWTLTRAGHRWLLSANDFSKLDGGTPIANYEDCADAPPEVSSAGPPTLDPPLPDNGYPPPDYDGDVGPVSPPAYADPPTTQDYGNGLGETGLCEDGTLSDSIGRQGACSYHGGVAD